MNRTLKTVRETLEDQSATPRALASLPQLLRLLLGINRPQTIMLVAIQVVSGLLPATAAFVVKRIVDVVAGKLEIGDTVLGSLLNLLIIGAGIAVGLVLLEIVSTLLQQLLQEELIPYLNIRLVEKAAELEYAFFERPDYYDMLSQAQREVSSRPVQLIKQTVTLIGSGVTIAGFTVIILTFSPWLTLVLLGTFVPSLAVQRVFSRGLFRLWRKQTPLMRMANYYKNLLSGIGAAMEIRIFQLAGELIGRLKGMLSEIQTKNISLTVTRSVVVGGLELASVAVYWLAFSWIIVSTLTANRFTVGDLVLFSTIFLQMRSQMVNVLSSLQSVYESGLFIDNFFAFLDLPTPEPPKGDRLHSFPKPIKDGIVFDDVTFYYSSDGKPALANINLHLLPGQRVAIVGENGAGKTTLAKLIARMYRPTRGSIRLDGLDLEEYDRAEYFRNLSVLNQGFVRYHLSVRDNIGFGDTQALNDMVSIQRAARTSGSDDFIDTLPEGYETQLGKMFEGSSELSAGQWQRLALARAYIADSQILILDEPTSSLDVATEAAIVERYAELTFGQIAILITHRFSTVRMADRILVLSQGRVVEDGSHDELMRQGGIYAVMFNTQAEPYLS